jgi:hypothetical protein
MTTQHTHIKAPQHTATMSLQQSLSVFKLQHTAKVKITLKHRCAGVAQVVVGACAQQQPDAARHKAIFAKLCRIQSVQ